MAEFIDVMRQYARLCAYDRENGHCKACPMSYGNTGREFTCLQMIRDHPERALPIITKWVKENPEPVYPSWAEWWSKTFSDIKHKLPCPAMFGAVDDETCGQTDRCDDCRARPIPADIAEKLGIKPIGGTTNG